MNVANKNIRKPIISLFGNANSVGKKAAPNGMPIMNISVVTTIIAGNCHRQSCMTLITVLSSSFVLEECFNALSSLLVLLLLLLSLLLLLLLLITASSPTF